MKRVSQYLSPPVSLATPLPPHHLVPTDPQSPSFRRGGPQPRSSRALRTPATLIDSVMAIISRFAWRWRDSLPKGRASTSLLPPHPLALTIRRLLQPPPCLLCSPLSPNKNRNVRATPRVMLPHLALRHLISH